MLEGSDVGGQYWFKIGQEDSSEEVIIELRTGRGTR